jgi:predicted small lipoprotein YifL
MRRVLIALITFATFALAGCPATTGPLLTPPPETATPAQKQLAKVQEVIAQGAATLVKAQVMLNDEIDQGILTKKELQSVQANLKKANRGLKAANDFIKENKLGDALNSANLADFAANEAEKILAKRIAERRKKP